MAHPSVDPPPGLRVLEIGSGHNPHPRSDVLCDRYLDDRERAGALVRDRLFAQADGQHLPFRGGAFGYSIAIHVAEHMHDIGAFFDELGRVSGGGYVETPSAIGEHLFGWRKHRWLLTVHDGTIYVRPKQAHTPFGGLFHELMRRDAGMTAIYYRYPDLFRVRCYWSGRIPYRIVSSEQEVPVDLDNLDSVAELLTHRSRPTEWLRAYVSRAMRAPAWRLLRDLRFRRRGGPRR